MAPPSFFLNFDIRYSSSFYNGGGSMLFKKKRDYVNVFGMETNP